MESGRYRERRISPFPHGFNEDRSYHISEQRPPLQDRLHTPNGNVSSYQNISYRTDNTKYPTHFIHQDRCSEAYNRQDSREHTERYDHDEYSQNLPPPFPHSEGDISNVRTTYTPTQGGYHGEHYDYNNYSQILPPPPFSYCPGDRSNERTHYHYGNSQQKSSCEYWKTREGNPPTESYHGHDTRKHRERYDHEQYILREAYRSRVSHRRNERKPYSYYRQSRENIKRSQGRRGQTPKRESSDTRSRTQERDRSKERTESRQNRSRERRSRTRQRSRSRARRSPTRKRDRSKRSESRQKRSKERTLARERSRSRVSTSESRGSKSPTPSRSRSRGSPTPERDRSKGRSESRQNRSRERSLARERSKSSSSRDSTSESRGSKSPTPGRSRSSSKGRYDNNESSQKNSSESGRNIKHTSGNRSTGRRPEDNQRKRNDNVPSPKRKSESGGNSRRDSSDSGVKSRRRSTESKVNDKDNMLPSTEHTEYRKRSHSGEDSSHLRERNDNMPSTPKRKRSGSRGNSRRDSRDSECKSRRRSTDSKDNNMSRSTQQTDNRKRRRSSSPRDSSNQRKYNENPPSPKIIKQDQRGNDRGNSRRDSSFSGGKSRRDSTNESKDNDNMSPSTEQTENRKRRYSGSSSPRDSSNQRNHNENPPSAKQIKQNRKERDRGNSTRDSSETGGKSRGDSTNESKDDDNIPPSSKPNSQKRSDSGRSPTPKHTSPQDSSKKIDSPKLNISERRERIKTTIYTTSDTADGSDTSECSDEKRASRSRSKRNPPIKSKSLLNMFDFTLSPQKKLEGTPNSPLKWIDSSENKFKDPIKDKPTEQDDDDDISDIIDSISLPHSPPLNEEEPLAESHVLHKEMKENLSGISGYMFKKLIKENNMREIRLPGNGFCFLSGLMITLEEQGINKDFPLLASEIMTEIRDNFQTQYKNVIDTEVDSEELFLQRCADYFQKGVYYEDCVDVCIGAAANALGINMNIFRKSKIKSGRGYKEIVTLASMDCSRFCSKVDLFLIYSPGTTKKGLDAHYNCLVNDEYFKTN